MQAQDSKKEFLIDSSIGYLYEDSEGYGYLSQLYTRLDGTYLLAVTKELGWKAKVDKSGGTSGVTFFAVRGKKMIPAGYALRRYLGPFGGELWPQSLRFPFNGGPYRELTERAVDSMLRPFLHVDTQDAWLVRTGSKKLWRQSMLLLRSGEWSRVDLSFCSSPQVERLSSEYALNVIGTGLLSRINLKSW